MQNKHSSLRSQYTEMNSWKEWTRLQEQTGKDTMIIVVTARPGFISYKPEFDNLPYIIYKKFAHTSVMLLYPDQWGDPQESVYVFTPNGSTVTRRPRTLKSWFKQILTS